MARKRLNKNLVVALSLTAFAAMILLSVLMLQRLAQRDPKYFVELAENAAAQQQWQQAAVFYDHAYKRSDDPRYLVQLGEMLLREGDIQGARISWMRALVQDPALAEGHIKQLQLLLRQASLYGASRDWEAVRDAAQAMLAAMTDAEALAMAHNALGRSLILLPAQDADPIAGLEHLQKARELHPAEIVYSIDVADEFFRQGKKDQAQELYDVLLASHDQPGAAASKIRTTYAQMLARRGDDKQAGVVFEQAISLAGDDTQSRREARLVYAGFLVQQWIKLRRSSPQEAAALLASAEQITRDAIADDPDAFDAYVQLANLYRLSGDYARVVEVCEERIARGLDRKGIEATQKRLSAFTLMTYASEASVALSVQAGAQGNFAERDRWLERADQYVTDARGEAPTHPMVLSQSGRVRIAKGQERAGLEDLRSSDEAFRSYGRISWENRIIRARVHLQLNEPGAARSVLEEVISDARSTDALFWSVYAQTLVQTGDLERAMAVVERVLSVAPANKDARRIKAAIYERQGKYAEAGQIEAELSGSGAVRAILQARAAALDGDLTTAIQILYQAWEEQPDDERLVGALVSDLVQANRKNEAWEVVRKAQAADPDNHSFQAIALSLREELTPEDRQRELLRLIETEEDEFKKAISLVALHTRAGDPEKTLAAIAQAEKHLEARDTPAAKAISAFQHAAILRTKMRAAAQAQDQDAMNRAREDAVRLNVDGADGKSIVGLYHFLRSEFELAAQALQAALESQPTQVSSWIMLGQSLQMLGRSDEATNAFAKASEVNPKDAAAHQGLAMLAQLRGDSETFARELAIAEKINPDDPWVREQVLIRKESANPAEAVAQREQQLANREDPANLQRLAELYASLGQKEKADKAHARLLELLPDNARIAVAAANYYRNSGRGTQAVEILQRFAKSRKTPAEQSAASTLVAGEQRIQGQLEGAEQTLLSAAALAPTIEVSYALGNLYSNELNNPAKALPWLDQAVEIAQKSNSPSVPALMERRILCLLHRELNDVDKARQEVTEFRRRFPDDPRGYLLQSQVQARAGEIDPAIASLTDYLSKRPGDVQALTMRAEHEITQGRLQDAAADLERIKQSAPASAAVQARILLARIHEREGRPDKALSELESLARETGSSAAQLELVSAYLRQRQFAEADRIATAMINRAAQNPDPQWFFLRGQISAELKETEKALADFRRGAEASGHTPASVSAVLGAYLALGQFAQGVQYYESLGSRDEKDAAVIAAYGRLLAKADKTTQAVEAFRQAMAASMSLSGESIRSLMTNLLGAFPVNAAIAHFEGVPCPPELARANERLLARLLAASKQFDQAQARLDSLIQKTAESAERASLLYEKAEVLQLAGDISAALNSYKQSLEHDPRNWYTLNNIAYILSDLRGEHEAALPFAKSAAAAADNPYTLDTLGWIYTHLGRHDAAVAELSRAIRLDPDYVLSYYHLGETYRRAGRFDEAIQVLQSAVEPAKAQKQPELSSLLDASLTRARARDGAP